MSTPDLFLYLGNKITTFFFFLGGLSRLAAATVFWMFQRPFKRDQIFEQAKKIGADSLPIVSLVSLFIGIILALQSAVQMQRLGSEMYIASLVALSVVRELGPVLTALIVAGRSGASITAEIGTMSVTEQIDALQTLATSPVKYLVVPRVIAATIMLPILTLYSDIIGILGGYLICFFKLNIASTMYLNFTFDALLLKDLFTGLVKSLFFGMIIAFVGCYEGFKVEGGAEGVGKATTASVVTTFILIISADCFFTALFYFIFP
jgi:phospholipid/cholesterol/gamma-HCH transport system permease protein